MKLTQIILFAGITLLTLKPILADELPESGPTIRIESEDNLDELSRACDLENAKSEELATKMIATQTKKVQTQNSSCKKLIEADRKFNHQVRQAKCESLEDFVPTEKAIQNCQSRLRSSLKGENRIEEDSRHRDLCILKLQSQYCNLKTDLSAIN